MTTTSPCSVGRRFPGRGIPRPWRWRSSCGTRGAPTTSQTRRRDWDCLAVARGPGHALNGVEARERSQPSAARSGRSSHRHRIQGVARHGDARQSCAARADRKSGPNPEETMQRRRQRLSRIAVVTAAPNARKAPRRRGPRPVHEPWTEARVDETYSIALAKIRAVLAEKCASLAPGSALHQYVVELAALSDDDLAAELFAARANSSPKPSSQRRRVH